jgi:UDP-N-acetylmuramyl pentapeptide phosphotransferase/UDP-N-acetylglucosamine-1-phosphate transferase
VALLTSAMVFPMALRFARKHDIVDNPNARKLQRVPVPVFGGIVVYLGVLAGWLVLMLFMKSEVLSWGLVAMTIMMAIGMWDDMRDLSATLRFVIEFALVGAFIAVTGVYIDDFHGLWGIHELTPWLAIPLSLVVGVGIINAVNLIDGVDGYSSGYGILACVCVAIAFWQVWNPVMVCLTVIVIGAIIPFFLHNVFGARSKMFIGDGGTLMLGTLMAVMIFCSLSSKFGLEALEDKGMSLIAFTIAVACIPVFDTLRVMTMRILRGNSPFSPDKTHLHHLFIDMGYSHLGAGLSILLMNTCVVGVWYLSWKLGASMDIQLYVVILLGALITFGFYKFMKIQQAGGPVDEQGKPCGTKVWKFMRGFGGWTHREDKRFWKCMQKVADWKIDNLS